MSPVKRAVRWSARIPWPHETATRPASPLTSAAIPAPALLAFARGIERRAAVFAELQCGHSRRGDAALGAALASFAPLAPALPVAQWPARFWALLLAAPPLREHGPTDRPLVFALLAEVGSGPRAALLLRLVAGLAESEAAAVLGIGRSTYRLALQRALPRLPDGAPDHAAWQAMGASVQPAIRALPADRLAHLRRIRDAALRGKRLPPPMVAAQPPSAGPGVHATAGRWRAIAIALVAVATIAALAMTFAGRPASGPDAGPDSIVVEPLPPPSGPAATLDAGDALLTDPDLDWLLADMPLAAGDPAFHAWLAAQASDGRTLDAIAASTGPGSVLPDTAHLPPVDDVLRSESDDAP